MRRCLHASAALPWTVLLLRQPCALSRWGPSWLECAPSPACLPSPARLPRTCRACALGVLLLLALPLQVCCHQICPADVCRYMLVHICISTCCRCLKGCWCYMCMCCRMIHCVSNVLPHSVLFCMALTWVPLHGCSSIRPSPQCPLVFAFFPLCSSSFPLP